jgi:hypothetical protein
VKSLRERNGVSSIEAKPQSLFNAKMGKQWPAHITGKHPRHKKKGKSAMRDKTPVKNSPSGKMTGSAANRKRLNRGRDNFQSLSPPLLRRVWATINEIPLTFLGVLALFSGAIILRMYFHRIGYMPTEVGALLTLFSAAAVIFFMLTLFSGAVLLYPALIARHTGVGPIRDYEVLVAELTALAAFLVFALLDDALGCNTGIGAGLYLLGTVLVILLYGNVYYGRLHWLAARGSLRHRLVDLFKYTAVMASVGLVTVFPLIVLQLPQRAWTSYVESKPELLPLGDTGIVLMWMSILLLNAACAKLKGRGSSLIFAAVMLFAAYAYLIWLPNAFGRESRFSDVVAIQLGIRLEGTSNLLVQEKSCEVLLASLVLKADSQIPKCKSGVNEVEAEVPARVGSTWFVGPQRINGVDVGSSGSSRVTLPDADVRLVVKNFPVKTEAKQAPRCSRSA